MVFLVLIDLPQNCDCTNVLVCSISTENSRDGLAVVDHYTISFKLDKLTCFQEQHFQYMYHF